MNIPEIAPTERQRFEDWYTLNAFDLPANPIGSRAVIVYKAMLADAPAWAQPAPAAKAET